MANLQKTLDALQPYVIGIRYMDGLPLVDAVFKDGWFLPESDVIKKVKGNDELNYFMLFSEKDGIGLDELLEYVDTVIKANIEREKKHDLLKEKVNELKEIFKKTSFTKLKKLKFNFADDELVPELNDFHIEEPEMEVPVIEQPKVQPIEQIAEPVIREGMTEEDFEIEQEELRAQNFLKIKEQAKVNGTRTKLSQHVELPPRKIQTAMETDIIDADCDCGPNDACDKCIDQKSL